MVILISGTTHTGKTILAQKLLEEYKIPYYSIDHLKMGLIRSGQTALTPSDDKELVPYLWSIVKEIIKTAIENKQSLVIEGCNIPFDWQKDFSREYLNDIKYCCLIMTANYIENHFADILKFENVIENRLCSGGISKLELTDDNMRNFELCKKFNLNYILIDTAYDINIKSVF
ncbi:MAG: adenylate kinase [Clostridia bacterium]|nr:adenylate kinase [Clostridia bacterium]